MKPEFCYRRLAHRLHLATATNQIFPLQWLASFGLRRWVEGSGGLTFYQILTNEEASDEADGSAS